MSKDDLMLQIAQYSVPELCDGMEFYQTMDSEIRQIVGNGRIVGTAFTIDVPVGEGGYVAEALLYAKTGDIIVISGKGNKRSSYWGDHRSICAKKLGVTGVIVDGAFRDIDGCESAGIPVFARAVTPGTALKTGKGRWGCPVACGGIVVNQGDIIVADRNGICAFPFSEADEILARSREKIKNQNYTIHLMEETGKILTTVIQAE
ncbi:RraA family protein [Lacrimispora sp.]|uniref:RraA family protein n=1 Tax=Lacrimispora sp. TaxID=2719234 RepID=UPI0034616FFA